MTENQKKGQELVRNKWLDNENRTWEFKFGYRSSLTAYINGDIYINCEPIETVTEPCNLQIPNGTIFLGEVFENKIVGVRYKNTPWVLRKI